MLRKKANRHLLKRREIHGSSTLDLKEVSPALAKELYDAKLLSEEGWRLVEAKNN